MAAIIFPNSTTEAKRLSREVKRGNLIRLYRGIYTNQTKGSVETVVQQNWMSLVAYLVPEGILSHRTALELRPVTTGLIPKRYVFVTGRHANTIRLPGLTIKISKGNTTDFVEPVLPNLSRTIEARALLECLSTRRTSKDVSKGLHLDQLEEFLGKLMQTQGEAALNDIRDQARQISSKLALKKAFVKLNALISSLLNSHVDSRRMLKTQFAKALIQNESYDLGRIRLFEMLALYLRRCVFQHRLFNYEKASWRNISFFESYFSNYIEGTEFLIDEAEDIVFAGKEVDDRHADSHDILSLFQLVNDLSELVRIPKNSDEFLSLLQERHALILRQRPDKHPGKWKTTPNKAGGTSFVQPSEVKGTLIHAFSIYDTLEEPLARAIFMMFIVAEVHPFDDGNGRLARVMMNAELAANDRTKILVPTVHRDNYLGGLRTASRNKQFQTYCKVLDQAQAYTAQVNWSDYGEAREKLEKDRADRAPDEGLPMFYRALRPLDLSDTPVD